MKLSADTKNMLIDVGAVAAGGIANMAAEYVTLKYVSQAATKVGPINVNAGDAVGLGMSAVAIVAGAKMKQYRVFLFGAGSLAVSLATLVGKAMISTTTASVKSYAAMQMAVPSMYNIAPAKKGNYR